MECYYIDPGSGMIVAGSLGWVIAMIIAFFGVISLFFKKIFRFIKKHKWKLIILILILIAAAWYFFGGNMNSKSSISNRVVILGFDGLSPTIIEPMIEAGELPNFARLQKLGGYSPLATTNPAQSPVAWSSFASGQNPGKHGVFGFMVRDPATYELSLSLSKFEKGKPVRVMQSKAFWQYASDAGVPTVILSCPVTFPPDKMKNGKMLSGMGVTDILGTEGLFTFYTSKKLDKEGDIGGRPIHINRSDLMVMNLFGPLVKSATGNIDNAKVLFKAEMNSAKDGVTITFQGKSVELKAGEWSDWLNVTFKLGLLKKSYGIFKFHLVSVSPEFKLYISPINFDPKKPYFDISYPPKYSAELTEKLGNFYTLGMPIDTWALNEGRLSEEPFLELADAVTLDKIKLLDLELGRLDKGVLFSYFESSDIIQHTFWRYIDPEHPLYEADAPRKYKDTIRNWYKKMDDILGSVMDKLNDDDTLIVLSDHGFATYRRTAHINRWLIANSYMTLKNGAKHGGDLLADVDWSKTKAYAIGFGGIYLNLEGREASGIVKRGQESETLKRELSEKIAKWRDGAGGAKVLNNVYTREEIFWGDFSTTTPDIFLGFSIGYRASWQTAVGAAPEPLIEDNLKKWSGGHMMDPALVPGVIFSNRKITKESPAIIDVAPTILKAIGFDEKRLGECGFDGEPLY